MENVGGKFVKILTNGRKKKSRFFAAFLLVGDFFPKFRKLPPEVVCRVSSDISVIPREAIGLKPPASHGVAGDVAVLIPRKEELPSVPAGGKLSREAALGEQVEQGDDGGEVRIHFLGPFWFGGFSVPFCL